MEVLCQFTKSYRGCKLLCHNNCFPLTFKARGRGLLTARRASGISGLVYGISVNVKHTFLRRRKRKKINGERKPKESERTEKQYHLCVLRSTPEFSQSRRFYKQAFIVVQDRYHFREIRATATGEVKQDTTEVSEK